MPDLNIRNVDQSLLRSVNVAAAKGDLTQRDFVIKALAWFVEKDIRPNDVVHTGRERTGEADKCVELAQAKPDPETSRSCPLCNKPMLPWGSMMRCQGCNRNF